MIKQYDFYEDPLYICGCEFARAYIDEILSKDVNFKWLVKKHESKSFEDMSFRYKNVKFSVLLRIYHNNYSVLLSYTERELKWVDITERKELFPIVFPIEVKRHGDIYLCRSLMDGLNFWDWMSTDIMNIFDITSF